MKKEETNRKENKGRRKDTLNPFLGSSVTINLRWFCPCLINGTVPLGFGLKVGVCRAHVSACVGGEWKVGSLARSFGVSSSVHARNECVWELRHEVLCQKRAVSCYILLCNPAATVKWMICSFILSQQGNFVARCHFGFVCFGSCSARRQCFCLVYISGNASWLPLCLAIGLWFL